MMRLKIPWYHRAVLYHIYPLSFADANGDGYGDIRGIINHLNYLNDGTADSLGIEAIWLSPIYASPMADWGYDVTDHLAVDPRFGSMADFEELLKCLHERGMKLLMDYVPNHTSHLHPWFVQSRSSRNNPKRDWYIWADPGKDGGPPNNWLSSFGGSAWLWDEKTGQYYLHTFLEEQPDLNWRNPQVRNEMLDVLRFWLGKGVDGFRADAVFSIIKDRQLRDDPPNLNYQEGISLPSDKLLRLYSSGQSEVNEVIGSFCDVLAEHHSDLLLSEAYIDIPGMQRLYQACKKHPVHAPFNFNLMSLSWSAPAYRHFIDEYENSLGSHDWPNYVLGNHDRHRLVTRVGKERARLLALLQLTLRGLPVIYYGDELGLPDGAIEPVDVRDPFEKRLPGHGLGRDVARIPMPWSADVGAGFTTGRPWLPVDGKTMRLNVEVQNRRPDSSLNFYRHLIHLRRTCPALIEGGYRSLPVKNQNVFAYIRETGLQRMLVVLNFDNTPCSVTIRGPVGQWIAGTHMTDGDGQSHGNGEVNLRAYEGRMYELRRGM